VGYVEAMQQRTKQAFDELHRGVSVLTFTDFPDYANVGDSAIALGQIRYWLGAGVEVKGTHSCPVLPDSVFAESDPVFINGGGSFGGLYGPLSEHRYRLAEQLNTDTLLIQGAQSVHFVSDSAKDEFLRRMAPRKHLRVAVRDEESFRLLRPHIDELLLCPDAVHLLGDIPAPPPRQKVVRLSRNDKEAVVARSDEDIDWPRDTVGLAAPWWINWRCTQVPALKRFVQRSNGWWNGRAAKRLARGVAVLSVGETIVTDRLHAMLIGLQMGRRVIARDNNNGKLSRYARTWFGDAQPENLTWA